MRFDENTPADGEAMSYEEEVMRSVEATRALMKKAEFKSNLHVSPTSTIVERTFSRAGIIMRPHRSHMDPSTLEMLLMLLFREINVRNTYFLLRRVHKNNT